MISLSKKEREVILLLFKGYATFYNANSLSKVVHISHVGAQKILKRLLLENILLHKTIGKSIIYKLNLQDMYARQLVAFLLADEAHHFKRWKEEFQELFHGKKIVLLFGSIVKDYTHAQDIDIMLVIENKDGKEVCAILKKKEELLPKKLHALKLTQKDLLDSLKKKDKAILDISKNAVVLYGQEAYVEILQRVTGF